MNMQSLMAQAQKIQKEVTKAKEEIDTKVFSFENEMVLIEFMGTKKLNKINIKLNKIQKEDIEILEDMINLAINGCLEKIDKETNEKLGKYSSALNGLM